MNQIIESIEDNLGIELSSPFRKSWNDSLKDRIPPFTIERTSLRAGKFAEVAFDETVGWIIRLRDNVPPERLESSLVHELLHIVLVAEGYPFLCVKDDIDDGEAFITIAEAIHSILIHPILFCRMAQIYGDAIELTSAAEIEEVLAALETVPVPIVENSMNAILLSLSHVHSTFEGTGAISLKIEQIYPSAVKFSDGCVSFMKSSGYFSPQDLEPSHVKEVGNRIIEELGIGEYFRFCLPTTNANSESA